MTSAPGGTLTLVIQKPDLMRGPSEIRSQVLCRIIARGVFPVILENRLPTEELLRLHYREHTDREDFEELIQFMMSGPICVGIFRGPDAVTAVRGILGHPLPALAADGTIRGDYRDFTEDHVCSNLIHASGTDAEASFEIETWFSRHCAQRLART
jgi:nucleoside-diphosphate kinase